MNTNRLFLTVATISVLGLGLTLPTRAQDTSSSTAQDQQSSSSDPQTSKAQDQKSGTSHPKKISQQEMKKKVTDINKASKFIGMTVKNLQNENLGKIDDLAIDPESGKIAYAVLSVGGFLGMNDKSIAVPLNALTPAPGADHLVLDADKQRLNRAPGFAKNKWPDLDTPAWAAAAGFPSSAIQSSTPASGGTGRSAQQQGTASQKSSQPQPSSSSPDQRDQASSTSSSDQPAQSQSSSSSTEKSDPQHYSGTVSAVDQSARTLTVSGDEGDKTFKLESNAQITVGSQNDAKIDDVKTGSKVSVEYAKEGDKSVAKSVQAKDDSSSSSSSNEKK